MTRLLVLMNCREMLFQAAHYNPMAGHMGQGKTLYCIIAHACFLIFWIWSCPCWYCLVVFWLILWTLIMSSGLAIIKYVLQLQHHIANNAFTTCLALVYCKIYPVDSVLSSHRFDVIKLPCFRCSPSLTIISKTMLGSSLLVNHALEAWSCFVLAQNCLCALGCHGGLPMWSALYLV